MVLQPQNNAKLHENMVETIRQAKDEYYGLIFGMSYSRKGIDRRKLWNRWFDFSCDGMDLYYNTKLLQYAIMTGKFKSAEEVWLVAPNYYMHYDQSMSITQYKSGQMFACFEFNDFHNFHKLRGEVLKDVQNYILKYQMFGRKITRWYRVKRLMNSTAVYAGKDGEGELPGGWLKVHENSLKDCSESLREFISLCASRNLRLSVIHPPVFIQGVVPDQVEMLKTKNKAFFDWIHNNALKIKFPVKCYDCTFAFPNARELFRDLEHLNVKGNEMLGELLNKVVLKKPAQ